MSNDTSTSSLGPLRLSGPEPRRTIYGTTWASAQRALTAPRWTPEQSALRDLASKFEVGWVFVRPILLYAQDHPKHQNTDPVVRFSVETAELYRELAEIGFGWISEPEDERHDTDSMASEIQRFATHVGVLDLAVRGFPDDRLAPVLRLLAREIPAWCKTITATVSTLGELWDTHESKNDVGTAA